MIYQHMDYRSYILYYFHYNLTIFTIFLQYEKKNQTFITNCFIVNTDNQRGQQIRWIKTIKT